LAYHASQGGSTLDALDFCMGQERHGRADRDRHTPV